MDNKSYDLASPLDSSAFSLRVKTNDDDIRKEDLGGLQEQWKDMFQRKLPQAATSKSSVQKKWPVHVDHCFARIILDDVVGGRQEPWIGKIKSPAYKNMSQEQLTEAIGLGERLLRGEVDLVALDQSSLACRGKTGAGKRQNRGGDVADKQMATSPFVAANSKKRKRDDMNEQGQGSSSAKKFEEAELEGPEGQARPVTAEQDAKDINLNDLLLKIDKSNKTAFQKRVLSLLCQVPAGSYTTYGSMARHLNSSARAVGNALRNNPFAPQVPCHRVLATGGGLGGFCGSWGRHGEEGRNDKEKRRLLREEGVKFDGKGKVVGSVWERFR
ncbi:MAG: hypothetical protein M1818_001786 [Claussenomyces sp. TS43310]|nr:MAG: hypothetical protein M1818_001786 [Claussenomyces sp. TS43310]